MALEPWPHDISELLRRHAAERPDAMALTYAPTGQAFSYAEFDAWVNRISQALAGLGVAHGSFVNLMLSNRPEYLGVSYALRRLGAVEVAINCEARGPALARMLNIAGAQVSITERAFAEAWNDVAADLASISDLVVVGGGPGFAGVGAGRVWDFEAVVAEAPEVDPLIPVGPLDTAMVIFTSGTTGPAKGCLLSHRSLIRSGECVASALELQPQDRVYTAYPLFHGRASALDVLGSFRAGAGVVLGDRFSASRFWPTLREHRVSVFSIIGTVMQILWKQPPGPADREHAVRLTWGGPITVPADDFSARFGARVLPGDGVFGMTETGMLNMSSFDPKVSGRIRDAYRVIIADADDRPVAAGEIGEILVRPEEPGVMFSGYLGMPEATVAATRNLWFHTGDLGRMDSDGRMTFVGRKNDMIRAGGHNISGWEVEEAISAHPDVLECAVVGAPSPLGEQEVVAFITLRPGAAADEPELLRHCEGRLARYMWPRRLHVLPEIPKTQSGKAAKSELLQLDAAGRR